MNLPGKIRSLGRRYTREFFYNFSNLQNSLPGRRPMSLNIAKYGLKIYSQNDEDGVIEYLFSYLKTTNNFFVEIGVGPPWHKGKFQDVNQYGLECNCRLLVEKGWNGVMLDGNSYPEHLNVQQEFITAENINEVLTKYQAPSDLDLFSLDVDGNDYWIWKALEYRPRVVIIEYNPNMLAHESKTIKYDSFFSWGKNGCTKYYGASLLALKKLGDEKDYTLVYANGVNAFFVESDLVPNKYDFKYDNIYRHRDVHAPLKGDEEWVEI